MSFQKLQGVQLTASADFHGMEMFLLYRHVAQTDLLLTEDQFISGMGR